jgi:quercetin dioxygenase-like cupin family protein
MKFRRVVTDTNKEGKAYVKSDTVIDPIPMRPGFHNIPMWATKKLPAEMTTEDPNTWELGTSLAGGSVFRLAKYDPGVAKRWHVTDSVDYAIFLAGELWMQLDGGEEVHLTPGTVIIQRQTMHNWENRGKEPCIMAYVLLATEGAKTTGWDH